jgi:uncharacterized protein (TIGR02266 family)
VAGNDSRVGERQTTAMRIKLKYPDVETFIQKYAVNISRGGIFIATKQPKAVGTFLKFEFLLSNADSQSIIRGEGQVQWTKEFDAANPARPHGMGVKFLRLDAASQEVVDRALRWRAEHGTSPNAHLPAAGSSAHATVTTREPSQARKLPTPPPLPPSVLATGEAGGTSRVASREAAPSAMPALPVSAEREALSTPDDDAPTKVRESSRAGKLPKAEVRATPPEEDTNVDNVIAGPPVPLGRREGVETRPIAIRHDEQRLRGRAPHEPTRPITLGERRAGDELDRLAHEWGLSEERLQRSLRRARPRIVEATAELERLLLKPPKPPALSRAEATVQLAALLDRRAARTAREANGQGPARDSSERPDEPATGGPSATESARGLQRAR